MRVASQQCLGADGFKNRADGPHSQLLLPGFASHHSVLPAVWVQQSVLLEDLHEELELLLVLQEELVVALHEGHSSPGAVVCDGEAATTCEAHW